MGTEFELHSFHMTKHILSVFCEHLKHVNLF